MRRYTGKCEIFFGTEHRLEKEEMEEQFNRERQRKDGDLQRTQQESPIKEQAVRIVSTRRVESSLQSIVTWEQLSEKEEEQWHQSQAMRVELPGLGKCAGRYASFFGVLLALGRLAGGSVEASQSHQTSMAGGM